MKYTRLEIKKPFTSLKFKVIIQFCIVIPLLSTIFGAVLSKCFIVYSNNRDSSKIYTTKKTIVSSAKLKPDIKNENKNKLSASSKDIYLYYLQAGAFSNSGNANLIVSSLNKKNIKSFMVKNNNLYRVIVKTSNDINSIKSEQDKLKKIGYITFIKRNESNIKFNVKK